MNATAKSLPHTSRFQDPALAKDFALQVLGQFIIKGDPRPTRAETERFYAALFEGDDLADQLVASFSKLKPGQGFQMLNQALESGLDSVESAGPELKALMKQVEDIPAWVDFDLVEEGARATRRSAPLGELILSCVSLMGGYRSGAANKPIALTGALTYNASRRLAETSQFTYDVTKPGGLQRFAGGFKSTVKVRMMHAFVRAKLRKDPNWNFEDWAEPINQSDMVGTNLLFSLVYLNGLRVLGVRFTDRESLAVMHLWRYVGYLLGINTDLIPETEEQGYRVAYLIGNSQPAADQHSRDLGQALMNVPLEGKEGLVDKMLGQLEVYYRSGLTRAILGDKAGDDLGLPDTLFKFSPLLTSPLVFAFESVRQVIKPIDDWAIDFGENWARERIERMLENKPASFQPA